MDMLRQFWGTDAPEPPGQPGLKSSQEPWMFSRVAMLFPQAWFYDFGTQSNSQG